MKKVLPFISCLGIIASIISYPSSVQALEPSEIYAKAKEFTVQIDGEETGTGTIIENNNGTYTVLTCWHVMDTPGSYQIATVDGATHQVTKIENLSDVDLAIITFTSSNTYPVAQLGDSATATNGLDIYVVGYNSPFVDLKKRQYLSYTSQVRGRKPNSEDGYQIIHSERVPPGSSGGGIFDNQARLIGVNGKVYSEENSLAGFSEGIPLEIYLAAQNNFSVPTNVTAPQDFVSVGKSKLKQKDYKGAIAEFNKALAANSNDIDSLHSRGEANYYLQNFQAVISDLDRIININPQDASTYGKRGFVYAGLEDFENAIANYDEAIRLNPQFASAYRARGLIYAGLEDFESAIADFDEAIRLNPQDTTAYYNRGIGYGRLEEYENAIADFDEAIRLNPQDATAYYNRGIGYSKLEDFENAIADFDEAIRLNPQDALAYSNRGNTYGRLKEYESAIANFDEAIRLNPQNATSYYNRGFSHKNVGNNSLAIKDFEQAAELYRKQDNTEWHQKAVEQIEQL